MVLKAKNVCWKNGERCQTHKHPSSFISSGEDGVGESPRSKKNPQTGGGCSIFSSITLFFFFHSLTLSLWYLTKCCLWEFVWVDGPDPSARQVSLSLSAWVQVCFLLEMLSSLCVYWSVVIEHQSCWDSAQMEIVLAKGKKRWKRGKIEVHSGTEFIIIKVYRIFLRIRFKIGPEMHENVCVFFLFFSKKPWENIDYEPQGVKGNIIWVQSLCLNGNKPYLHETKSFFCFFIWRYPSYPCY